MRRSTASLIAVALLTACQAAPSTEADTQAIAASRARVQAAENSGQADSMVALMADDVIILPPGAPTVTGRAAFGEFVRSAMQTTLFHVEYQSVEVVVSGDWAFDRGTYAGTMTPKAGGAAVNDRGNYLWLLHRERDGTWRYARSIWNADAAPVPAP